jgi:IPT/TIG domain
MRLLTSFALLAAGIPLSDAEGTIWGVTTNGGSLFGGTKLLIHGHGFSSMNGGTKTIVLVGTDECQVEPYFSSDNLITCYTAPAPKDQRGNWIAGQQLPIKVTNPTQLNTRQMVSVSCQ